jgi:hypothetical protein
MKAHKVRSEATRDWNRGHHENAFENFEVATNIIESASESLFDAATGSRYWDTNVYYQSPPDRKPIDEKKEYNLLKKLAVVEAEIWASAWTYLKNAGVDMPEEVEADLFATVGVALSSLQYILTKDQKGVINEFTGELEYADIDEARTEYLVAAHYLNMVTNDLITMTDEDAPPMDETMVRAYAAERISKMLDPKKPRLKKLEEIMPRIEKEAEKGRLPAPPRQYAETTQEYLFKNPR